VTRPGRAGETLFDAEPGAIAVPVLVISNQNDTCAVSPPGDAPNVLAALTRSPRKELVMVTSSQIARRSDPCEGDVAARLSWDRGHGRAAHLRLDQNGWRALTFGKRSLEPSRRYPALSSLGRSDPRVQIAGFWTPYVPRSAVPFPRIVKKLASDLPAKKHRSATVAVISHGVKGSGRWTSVSHLRPVLPIPFPSICKGGTRIGNI
jgi:hypothetical protein